MNPVIGPDDPGQRHVAAVRSQSVSRRHASSGRRRTSRTISKWATAHRRHAHHAVHLDRRRQGRSSPAAGYLASDAVATTVFLASELGKPLLVEGPAGVGKTELSSAVAEACGADLVRLQCYEGVDEARALYEWNHAKQLLRITAGRDETWDEARNDIFSEEFLLARPLLTAIRNEGPTVLLIDETDKADVEIEGLLLEVLGEFQVTVPELGTIKASSARSSC